MPRLFMGIGWRIRWKTLLFILGVGGSIGGPYLVSKWKEVKAEAQSIMAEDDQQPRASKRKR